MANKGKIFEAEFKNSAKNQGIFVIRINDQYMTYKSLGQEQWAPKSMCDYLIFDQPNLFAIECKSTTYKRIGIQRHPDDPDAMIHAHQINSLVQASLHPGVHAGFLLNWRNDKDINDNNTYWISIQHFSNFLEAQDKKSMSLPECIEYGGIQVDGVLKRTHYLYDIGKMLEEIRKEG